MDELKRAAACDAHLPNALRRIVPENKSKPFRVTHVGQADEHYMCECGVPAHWFIREIREAKAPAEPREVAATP